MQIGHIARCSSCWPSSSPWATAVVGAFNDASALQSRFRREPWMSNLADFIAPRGLRIEEAGNRSSYNHFLPPRLNLDFLPPLAAAVTKPNGYSKITSGVSHLVDWSRFFDIFASSDIVSRSRLLTQSGHGSVACLSSDTPCFHAASPESVRVTLRRVSGTRAWSFCAFCT